MQCCPTLHGKGERQSSIQPFLLETLDFAILKFHTYIIFCAGLTFYEAHGTTSFPRLLFAQPTFPQPALL